MNDVYASHLPVLKALSWVMPMRRVLEFGGGLHSTPFFLSLPELEKLVTVETDLEWRARLAFYAFADERMDLREDRPLSSLKGFDLVFIDDGETSEQRVGTIRWVLSQPHPPVVIHDCEVAAYRQAIDELSTEHFTFKTTPRTELVR